MYYDENDPSHISIVGFIGPGFTTYSEYSDLNAGYRIYTMDGDYKGTTNSLLDADTYILNMTGALKFCFFEYCSGCNIHLLYFAHTL